MSISTPHTLMVHGGAGALGDKNDERRMDYKKSIVAVLTRGEELLQKGACAIDVVEQCVSLLEDNPLFNAGRGSVLTEERKIECDAAIMDGRLLAAGAVAGVKNIKNPVQLARCVMERSEHVMLIGEGAAQFAEQHNIARESDDYFVTAMRIEQWQEAQKQERVVWDKDSLEKKFGTVGAVAYDRAGNLAAATSTGGIVNKKYGRVGDSPIIGAGTYADNETCAVSATGYGEQLMKIVIAKTIADFIRYRNLDAQMAAEEGIRYLSERVNGLGGVIVIDRQGRCGAAHSTPHMIYGSVREDQDVFFSFE